MARRSVTSVRIETGRGVFMISVAAELARMHPQTAGRLVRAATERGALVLDPLCGSGTVLVEAMIAGRRGAGTDLNPLAERLARSIAWCPVPPAYADGHFA